MNPRIFAIAGIVLLVLASVPFVTYSANSGHSSAVPFGTTKQTGLSQAAVRQADTSPLVLPKAEVYYSHYSYVVGYFGVSSLVAGLRIHDQREFGRPLTIYISDFSGTGVSIDDAGHPRIPDGEVVGWTSAQTAYFVVNSSARVPSQQNAIIPFSNRSDARLFAHRYGGEIQRWAAVRQLPVGRADRSVHEWNTVVRHRQGRANRSVARSQTTLDRPVSLVVGHDVPTIAAALNRAPPNTTVVVPPGTYQVDGLRIRKSVTLRGSGSNATHIVGDRNGSVIFVSAPRTAIRSLSISGIGPNRTGLNRSLGNISVSNTSWRYKFWKVHGFGDAAIVFDTAPQSLVADVRVNTTSNGIISRNSANLTVSGFTLYGTKRSEDGFLGVASLGSPVIVQHSHFFGGKVGVYTFGGSRTIVRNSSMEGMKVGVFDLFSSRLLVANTIIEDTWTGVFIDSRSYGTAVVGSRVHNSRNGIFVRGRSNYVADNVVLHNKHGLIVDGQYSLYRHNILLQNHVGARGLSLFPTNRMTANDFIHNHQYVETFGFNVLHLWRGNYWQGAPGFDWDGDDRLLRAFQPTGPVDEHADEGSGILTLARSPALRVLRQLQQVVPGLRSAGIIDPRPRATPARPAVVRKFQSLGNGTGRHSDPDPWDSHDR